MELDEVGAPTLTAIHPYGESWSPHRGIVLHLPRETSTEGVADRLRADDDMRWQVAVATGTKALEGGNGEAQPLGKPACGLKGTDGHA